MGRPAPADEQTPLLALAQQIQNFGEIDDSIRGSLLFSLMEAAAKNTTTVQKPQKDPTKKLEGDAWTLSKTAAFNVGVFACPAQRLREVLPFGPEHLSGLKTFEAVRQTPSASLRNALQQAKARACGDQHNCGLIMVSLVDVHILELGQQEKANKYISFAQTFVLGVAPEGVILWQGWGDEAGVRSYLLGEWMSKGGSRIRNWQEAGDVVETFEKFVANEVSVSLLSC